jgi:hypothetical protein
MVQARLRFRQMSLALLLAGLLLGVSLVVLYLNAQAKARGSGAFGCGVLDQAVIDSLAPGDTIMMMQFETASGGLVAIGKELTIQGGWRPKSDDCDSDINNNPIPEFFDTISDALVYFTYSPTVISDLPASSVSGPILTISPNLTSTVTLQQLQFDFNNINNQSGAGLSGTISNSARVRLDRDVFANNSANPGNGAGLDLTLTGGSRLDIGEVDFLQNFALNDGGGARLILQNGSTAMITESLFASFNEANRGAGLYAEVRGGSHLILSEVEFSDGIAQETGGGFEIHVFDNSRVTIDDVQVSNNDANNGNGGGGRIVIHSGFVAVTNSNFSNNDANNGRGGGLAIEGAGSGPAFALLMNNTIINNTASIANPNLYITGNVTIFNRQMFLPVVRKNSSP